jgi:hypothetical protein
MLTGDDLSTQYFIAGTAIALLGVGITQAGWTQRWLVRSFLMLGAALLLCSFFWKLIVEQFPKISGQTIGSSSLAWLSLLVCTLIVILCLDYKARTANLSQRSLEVSTDNKRAANISSVRLVPSSRELALVVTPACGGFSVGMFADISHWSPAVIPRDWSKVERLYLGDMPLRAANVKFSHSVMEYGVEGLDGWLWKFLDSQGVPSGTRPCFVHGRMRATFVFIDPNGAEERFPFLLVRDAQSGDAPPIVVASSDLPE